MILTSYDSKYHVSKSDGTDTIITMTGTN